MKRTPKPNPSWKPVRDGRFYCAPSCGRGCTWTQYQNARAKAERVARMLGAGWKAAVHETDDHWKGYVQHRKYDGFQIFFQSPHEPYYFASLRIGYATYKGRSLNDPQAAATEATRAAATHARGVVLVLQQLGLSNPEIRNLVIGEE